MKDKRLEKIKKHYFIQINNHQFKILNSKVDLNQEGAYYKNENYGAILPS